MGILNVMTTKGFCFTFCDILSLGHQKQIHNPLNIVPLFIGTRVMQELTTEIREQFKEFLDIHENLMVIDGRCPRSTKMDILKTVLTKLAEPFRVSIH